MAYDPWDKNKKRKSTAEVLYPTMVSRENENEKPKRDPQEFYYERLLGRPLSAGEKWHPSTIMKDDKGNSVTPYWGWLRGGGNVNSLYESPAKTANSAQTMQKNRPVAQNVSTQEDQTLSQRMAQQQIQRRHRDMQVQQQTRQERQSWGNPQEGQNKVTSTLKLTT